MWFKCTDVREEKVMLLKIVPIFIMLLGIFKFYEKYSILILNVVILKKSILYQLGK